ncbi:MAG: HAD family phosphatase [Leucobacter sp.]|nr:HAD family phosphatase [Leucobacter sp.]
MNAESLDAVLWDMDGTLIDSEPLWLRAELAMLERFGIEMTAATHERLIGSGLWEAAEHFRELGVPMPADDIVAEWVVSVTQGLHEAPLDWRPGARELLRSLTAAGVPCALVTMSTRSLAEAVIASLEPGMFQAVIAGDEVTFAKPHPEPYLLGAAALGVEISRCVALEDSPTGLRSAYASGAVAVGIPNLLPLTEEPSHQLLPTLAGVDAAELRNLFHAVRTQVTDSAIHSAHNADMSASTAILDHNIDTTRHLSSAEEAMQ